MKRALYTILRAAFVQFLYWSGALFWAKTQLRRRRAVTVLMFHRVLTAAEQRKSNCVPGIVVSESTFARVMHYLRRNCEAVDLAAERPQWDRAQAKPLCAVTFDDGWIDNAGTAFEIAKSCRIPFTIFICPELMGRKDPFWTEHVVELLRRAHRINCGQLPDAPALTELGRRWLQLSGSIDSRVETLVEYLKTLTPAERDVLVDAFAAGLKEHAGPTETVDATMSWEDVGRLQRAGVVFGLHTQTHQILTRVPAVQVREELENSKRKLEEILGRECPLLAYPNGDCSAGVRRQAEAAGYRRAFTVVPEPWTVECDPLLIPRINIWEGSAVGATGRFSRAALEYTLFWKPWRRMQRVATQRVPVSPEAVLEGMSNRGGAYVKNGPDVFRNTSHQA